MRMVVESRICDACLAWKGVETEADIERVEVVKGWALDLCREHREGTSRVFALLAEFGTGAELVKARPNGKRATATVARRVETNGATAVLVEPAPTKSNRRGGARARARRNNSAPVSRSVEVVADERFACPLCPHTSKSTSALGVHLHTMHARNLSDVYGRVCPLCGAECTTTGALGVHGATSHGIPRGGGVVSLFVAARDAGDPLDVIASRASAIVEAASN